MDGLNKETLGRLLLRPDTMKNPTAMGWGHLLADLCYKMQYGVYPEEHIEKRKAARKRLEEAEKELMRSEEQAGVV